MKQPKLILRESAVYDMSCEWPPGRFVEMGGGTGHMGELFARRGFEGVGHDLSAASRADMRRRFENNGLPVQVVDDINALPSSSFDYLIAFEVLEHIERDVEVFTDWLRVLRPGGKVLVSVPAHMHKYGRSDELVGHVRRYERKQLHDLLANAGISDIRIINYGFPVTEATRTVGNWLVRNDKNYEQLDPEQRSMLSARTKPKAVERVLRIVGERSIMPFCAVQRWFYNRDLGDGLIASGTKA
jgi:SAM-dependent methyltransferase